MLQELMLDPGELVVLAIEAVPLPLPFHTGVSEHLESQPVAGSQVLEQPVVAALEADVVVGRCHSDRRRVRGIGCLNQYHRLGAATRLEAPKDSVASTWSESRHCPVHLVA